MIIKTNELLEYEKFRNWIKQVAKEEREANFYKSWKFWLTLAIPSLLGSLLIYA